MEMLTRMETGRFKVFKHLNDWFQEFSMYHRKDSKVVKEGDDLMGSLDAKGRQMLADLESPSKPVRARRKRGPKVEIEHNVTQSHPSNSPHAILGCEEIKRAGTSV